MTTASCAMGLSGLEVSIGRGSARGLQDALRHARAGDVFVVHTLERLGRTVRDTLNLVHELLVHELKERGAPDFLSEKIVSMPAAARASTWLTCALGDDDPERCRPGAGAECAPVCAFVDPESYLTWGPAESLVGVSLDPAPKEDAEFPSPVMLDRLQDLLGPPGQDWSFRVLNGDVPRALTRLAESTAASRSVARAPAGWPA